MTDARTTAQMLGGDVSGPGRVLCPGPGHGLERGAEIPRGKDGTYQNLPGDACRHCGVELPPGRMAAFWWEKRNSAEILKPHGSKAFGVFAGLVFRNRSGKTIDYVGHRLPRRLHPESKSAKRRKIKSKFIPASRRQMGHYVPFVHVPRDRSLSVRHWPLTASWPFMAKVRVSGETAIWRFLPKVPVFYLAQIDRYRAWQQGTDEREAAP